MSEKALKIANQWIVGHQSWLSRGFCLVLFGFFTIFLASLSIQYTDTDLWYHLTGGRYLLEHGALYNPLTFSYLEVERSFINYYWGFQALTFGTWMISGETGLILLKAGLLLTSGYFAARIILDGKPVADARFLQLLVIAIVISMLCARGLGLRPHLASYAFIPIFIYILGYRQKLYPMLPVLTIIWVNLHGVEWVVGALICGSYFLQHLGNHFYERDELDSRSLVCIALCFPAMMINPNGVYVLMTPFVHDEGLKLFILELAAPSLKATLDLQNGLSFNTLVLGLLLFVVVAVVHCLRDIRHYIAPLLIAFGGLVLLAMAKRFMWEWALLSLPVIAAGLQQWRGPQLNVSAVAVLLAMLVLVPATYWPTMRHGLDRYPYDRDSLPYGTTEFIKQNNMTGRYAAPPSFAGYVEFVLVPDVQIHMDMQFPPFTSMDIHEYNTAMYTQGGLRHYVATYEPDMIGVKKSNQQFPVMVASELGYRAVFFDQKLVLFVNINSYPEIVARHELRAINPFAEKVILTEQMREGVAELERMLQFVDSADVKLVLVALLIEQGQVRKANVYLDELRRSSPPNPSIVYYSGRAAHLSGDYQAAVEYYEDAIAGSATTPGSQNKELHGYVAECYFLLRDSHKAYAHFRQSINPYTDKAPDPLRYYQFALSAIGVGEVEQAKRLLVMIQRFAPTSELLPEIEALLGQLEA